MFDIDSIREIRLIKQSERQKVLLVSGPDGKKYLKREINGDKRELYKSLQKINHTNVPKIYHLGFNSDTIVIEEYIEGISLSDFMEQNKKLSKKQIYSISNQLLSALDKLHEYDIIHRDIKPDNILIDESNHIWLTDYDIARIYRKEVRRDTETMGTFGYAPIEQYGMLPTDFKTDIYAFGVTLKSLLDYLNIKGFLYKVAEKCKRLDPQERYKNVKKIKNVLLLHRFIPVVWVVVLILLSVLAVHTLNNENETVLNIQQESETISEDKEYVPEDDVPNKEEKNETVVKQEDSKESKDNKDIKDSKESKEIKEPEKTTFEGTFSEFQDGPTESQYKNYNMYSQVCIFNMQYPWEHLIFIDDVTKTGKLKLGKNETIIDATITLENGKLSVNLKDEHGKTFNRQFQYNGQYDYDQNYTDDLKKSADIICYGFDEEEGTELLIGLGENSMGAVGKQFYNNFNYCMAWCIKYDEKTGFSLCDGDMFSKGYSFYINNSIRKLNVSWEDIGDVTGYVLEDNKIISTH